MLNRIEGIVHPPLSYQPDPPVLSFPFCGDKFAQSAIVRGTLHSNASLIRSGALPASRYSAILRPHSAEQIDPAERSFRSPSGPYWKILSIQKSSAISLDDPQAAYHAKLVPVGPQARHPVYLYRDLMNRGERHIPNDKIGRQFLGAKSIYHPLSRKICNERGMIIAKAEESVKAKRQELAHALTSGTLSPTQSEVFKNPLFAEHVECGRIDMTTARGLAEDGMNLFYCLSLLPLFRAGTLQLPEVSTMPEVAIRLLHDARMVKLFYRGLLSKAQLMSLTLAQYILIKIFCRPLLTRQVSAATVLALSDDQIAGLDSAGLMNDLASGRIPLATALEQIEPAEPSALRSDTLRHHTMAISGVATLLSKWPVGEMQKAFYDKDGQPDAQWNAVVNRISEHLPELQQVESPGLNISSSSSSSSSSVALPSFASSGASTGRSLKSIARSLNPPKAGVPLSDVALLLSRMPSELLCEIIYEDGYESKADWVNAFGHINIERWGEDTTSSFASLLVDLGLEKNQGFLRAWTNDFGREPDFDADYRFYRAHLGYQGIAACHALFSPIRQLEYGLRAHRFMSRAIDKEAEGFVEED